MFNNLILICFIDQFVDRLKFTYQKLVFHINDLPPDVSLKSCPIRAFVYFTDECLHNVSVTGS